MSSSLPLEAKKVVSTMFIVRNRYSNELLLLM